MSRWGWPNISSAQEVHGSSYHGNTGKSTIRAEKEQPPGVEKEQPPGVEAALLKKDAKRPM